MPDLDPEERIRRSHYEYTPPDRDREQGLYAKYFVQRYNDPERKHDNCPYFVLDLKHDAHARKALEMYIVSCQDDYPELSYDLKQLLEEIRENLAD